MDNTKYENFGIDAADIWEYECDHYDGKEEHGARMKELYELLKPFYLMAGLEPFIQSTDDGPYARGYREHHLIRNAEEVNLSYFIFNRAVYSMSLPCRIRLNEQNKMVFQKLFILKASQYINGLVYLEPFLQYQLKENFKNNLIGFKKFWNLSLVQYPGSMDPRIIQIVDDWFAEPKEKKVQKAPDPKPKRKKVKDEEITNPAQTPDLIRAEEFGKKVLLPITEITEPVKAVTGQTIPEGYEVISGNFTNEEIIHYFSFLYKEKSKGGQSFLSEKEVREIFKYGLAIPSSTETQKYKLNCSLKFPKGIVEFCIYKFIAQHTRPHNKKKVLKFFAHYIVDFASHIRSKKAFQSWSNNVVGRRPEKMEFALKDYLPGRMQN